jgi:hypothetical protein
MRPAAYIAAKIGLAAPDGGSAPQPSRAPPRAHPAESGQQLGRVNLAEAGLQFGIQRF